MDPTIIAAIIAASVTLLNILVLGYFSRRQMDFERRMKFPLSELGKKSNTVQTPNVFDLEYRSERSSLVDAWGKSQAERPLDQDTKEKLFRDKASGFQVKADALWNSPIRADRYRCALVYLLGAEASVLGSDFSKAGNLYHYSAMIWRTLEEWDRSGGYYYLSALCHLLLGTEVELMKARRSLTRSMASYRAGLNYEGYAIAKAKYEDTLKSLKTKFGWSYCVDQIEEFEQLLNLTKRK